MLSTFSICGYSNHLSWLEFCDEDIDSVEKYVKNELLHCLEKKIASVVGVDGYDSAYKSIFFGCFEFDVTSFQYHSGERRELYKISSFVKETMTNKNFYFDTSNGQKISNTNTVNLPFGVFFGNANADVRNNKLSAELGLNQYSYSFWEQIELDLKLKIRPHIKNSLQ